jgi:uncharacterized protein (DUF58 family)
MRELLKKLHKFEISIRKAINDQMMGDFHSIFKGSGLDFDDVRSYQYGDDIRSINWNVSAKGHGTFVKTYREEKEQTVFFILDVSKSQEIGKSDKKKIDIGKEICGVLSISAVKEQSKVGLLCFSDQKEVFLKADKGIKQAYQIIFKIFRLSAVSDKTNLTKAFRLCRNILKRKSVIIVISDFIDDNYQFEFKAIAKKHDLVVIHLTDPTEYKVPSLGIIPVIDNESGKTVWINSSSGFFRQKIRNNFQEKQKELSDFCKKYQANYLAVNTAEDYVPELIKLFKVRNRSGR